MVSARYISDFRLYQKLLRQARPYWLHIGGIFVLGLLSMPLALLMPLSIPFLVYAFVAGVSMKEMSVAGLIPAVEACEQTILQTVIPPERQGRVFGFAQSVEQAASPITALLIGPEQAAGRVKGEQIGHVTTHEYGSQMLSLGGVRHLTGGSKAEGNVTCDAMMRLCNKEAVEMSVDGGSTIVVQVKRRNHRRSDSCSSPRRLVSGSSARR